MMKLTLRHSVLLICCLPCMALGACPAVTRVGISDLGYSSFRDGATFGGLSVDVVREAARRAGCNIEFVWFPRQRMYVELEAGRIDMAVGSVRTMERDGFASFLPYSYMQYDLVLNREAGPQVTSLKDFVLRGTGRLNIVRGLKYGPAIEQQLVLLAAAGRLEVVNDFDTVFTKLGMGRADGTLASPLTYGKSMKSEAAKNRMTVTVLPESPHLLLGMYLSKKTIDAETRQTYAAALKAMVNEQAVQALYLKYLDEPTVKRLLKPGSAALLTGLSTSE